MSRATVAEAAAATSIPKDHKYLFSFQIKMRLTQFIAEGLNVSLELNKDIGKTTVVVASDLASGNTSKNRGKCTSSASGTAGISGKVGDVTGKVSVNRDVASIVGLRSSLLSVGIGNIDIGLVQGVDSGNDFVDGGVNIDDVEPILRVK